MSVTSVGVAPGTTRRGLLCRLGAWSLGASSSLQARDGAPRIVASFSLLADIVRMVAPPDAQVTSLVGPEADAHVFEPTPADARRLAQADLVVVNGLGFEGWMERLVAVSGFRGAVVVATRAMPHPSPASQALQADPHAWQNLTNTRSYVGTVRDALVARWPLRRDEIMARSASYDAELRALHAGTTTSFAAVPRDMRRVVTTHEAFAHFGAAYGIDFLAAQSWNNQGEPSAAAVARLIRQIRQQRVQALFIENITSRRLMERIAQESGVRVGGTLYADALSRAGGPADTYLRLFSHNVRTLLAALAPVPATGAR